MPKRSATDFPPGTRRPPFLSARTCDPEGITPTWFGMLPRFAEDSSHGAALDRMVISKAGDVNASIFERALDLPPGSIAGAVRRMPLGGSGTSARLFRLSAMLHGDRPAPSLILKLPPSGEAREGGFWQTRHYRREVDAYALLQGLDVPAAPRCYSCAIADEPEPAFHLLLEDCAGDGTRQFTLDDSWGPRQLSTLVGAVASLHNACFRADLDPHEQRDWRPGLERQGEMDEAGVLDRFKVRFADRLSPQECRLVDIVLAHADALARIIRAPLSLVHGDLHPLNVFFAADKPQGVKFVDWQFAGWGAGAADLADILVFYTPPLDRRRLGPEMVELYHRSVSSHPRFGYRLADLMWDYDIFTLLNLLKPARLAENAKLPAGLVLRLFKRACLAVAESGRKWPLVGDQIRSAVDEF